MVKAGESESPSRGAPSGFSERDGFNLVSFLGRVGGFVVALWRWLRSKSFAWSCVLFVVLDVLNTVFYKRMIDHTKNYVLFSVQLMIGTFWALVSALGVLCWAFRPRYMRRHFDARPLVLLGFLDMLNSGLSASGSAHTSGLMLVLLGQVSVPLTMVACKLFLSKRYHFFQYVSAFIILFFAVLKPVLDRADTNDNRFYNNMLYLVASVPDSIASALREKQYTSKFFHVIKYQFFGFSLHFFYNLLYTAAVYLLSHPPGGYLRSLRDLYVNGFRCVFRGINSIVDHCGPAIVPTCDNCSEALKMYCLYTLFGSAMRVAYVLIMLDGSVTFALLLGTVKVPLTSLAFSLRFIAGDSTARLNFLDVLCFLGIVAGLLLYALGSKRIQQDLHPLQTPLLDSQDSSDLDILTRGTEHLMQSETCRDLFT